MNFSRTHSPRAALAGACAPALLALLAAGCSEYQKPRHSLEDLPDCRILAIPLGEQHGRTKLWFGWSERGRAVVGHFRNWVEENWAIDFVTGREAEEIIHQVTRWNEDRIEEEDWRRLAAGRTVEAIVVGEITEFLDKQPTDVGFHRGSAKMRYWIIDARTGKTRYSSPEREVEFPKQGETDIPFSVFEFQEKPKEIENGLLKALGERLGKDLYGYYAP